jgi:uncharacterized protein involved in exopolysaccharide biosynthesis
MRADTPPNSSSEWMRPLLTAFFIYWRLVVFVPATCMVLTLGACLLLSPLYSGGFSLLVKAPEIDRTTVESGTSVVMRPGLVLENVIADEIKILQSHELFRKVAKALKKEGMPVDGLQEPAGSKDPAEDSRIAKTLIKTGNYLNDLLNAVGPKDLAKDLRISKMLVKTRHYAGGLLNSVKSIYPAKNSRVSSEDKNEGLESRQIETLAADLARMCVVAPAKGSDVIEITIRHHDRQAMRSILDHYLMAYYQLREEVWFNSEAPVLYQTASDNYYTKMQDLLNDRVALKQETTVFDPTREKDKWIEKQATNAAEIYDLQTAMTDLQNQLDRLKTLSPMQSLTFLQEETANDKLFSELKLQIAVMQAQRAKLLGDFNQQASLVKKVDYQLEELYSKYYWQLFSFIENKMASVQIRMDVLQSGLAQVKKKLVELERYHNWVLLLDKKIELYREHYFDHSNRAMKIEQQKDLRKNIATVNVVSQPFVNLQPHWPRPTTMVPLAFVLGLFLSLLGIVFLRSTKNAYLLPEEISRDLNLPVLASYIYRKSLRT